MDAGGGVLSLGTAMFQESWTNQHVNEAVMRTVATPDIKAFWPAGSDGDVVSHGGAEYNGSLPSDDPHAWYGMASRVGRIAPARSRRRRQRRGIGGRYLGRGNRTTARRQALSGDRAGNSARASRIGTRRRERLSPRRGGRLRLVRRHDGAGGRDPVGPAREGHRADRPVGVRQVDLPAHPQSHARIGAGGQDGRRGAARRARTSTRPASGSPRPAGRSAWSSRSRTRSRPCRSPTT